MGLILFGDQIGDYELDTIYHDSSHRKDLYQRSCECKKECAPLLQKRNVLLVRAFLFLWDEKELIFKLNAVCEVPPDDLPYPLHWRQL